jgi:hypothetical protein
MAAKERGRARIERARATAAWCDGYSLTTLTAFGPFGPCSSS